MIDCGQAKTATKESVKAVVAAEVKGENDDEEEDGADNAMATLVETDPIDKLPWKSSKSLDAARSKSQINVTLPALQPLRVGDDGNDVFGCDVIHVVLTGELV